MAPVKSDERIDNVVKMLGENGVETIVLTGKHGIGKTWTARKVFELARKSIDSKSNHLKFGFTLWVSVNQKFNKSSLYDKISTQLILPSIQRQEDDDDDEEHKQEEHKDEFKKPETVKEMEKIIKEGLENERYLLIMDDEGGNGMTDDLLVEFKKLIPPSTHNSKILITKTVPDDTPTNEEPPIQTSPDNTPTNEESPIKTLPDDTPTPQDPPKQTSIPIEALLEDESYELVKKIVKSESLNESQLRTIAKMCHNMPDQIIVIANLLSFLLKFHVWNFEAILEELFNSDYQKATDLLASEFANIEQVNMKFPDLAKTGMTLFECTWQSKRIFEATKCSIHYNDLITYWILEGCLGHVDEIEKAYETGHTLLLEMVELGLLTKHDDNFVSMNRLFLQVTDYRRYGFRGIASLGLENIFQDDSWEGVGKLSTSITTDQKSQSNEKVSAKDPRKELKKDDKPKKKDSALLIDWHCLSRLVPETLFLNLSGIRVLGLFNPTFESIPSSISSLQQLNVLVIRACPFLNNVASIEELPNLIVLEITGATSLEKIPDTLFKNMTKLRTISISGQKIESVPSSISGQSELRHVIVRDCSTIKKIPYVIKSNNIKVIDVSGCKSLLDFEDKCFKVLVDLQFLDASDTQLRALPIVKQLGKLSRLLLSDSFTPRLRFLDDVTGIEIIDMSNIKLFKELKADVLSKKTALRVINFSGTQIVSFLSTESNKMLETIDLSRCDSLESFEDVSLDHLENLRLLNVSNTKINELPNLKNHPKLRFLLVKDCSELKKLGEMTGLPKLETIDLSNAEKLETIENLSHENLRQILLQGCGKLQILPTLATATKLEQLDLSGCESLTEIKDTSFEHLIQLKKLNLSKTKINSLPLLSGLTKLENLSLKDCTNLVNLSALESLTSLKELDLSGADSLAEVKGDEFLQHMKDLLILNLTGIPQVTLTSMSHLPRLKQLILKGCTNLDQVLDLEKLSELEILDLSETKISSLPSLQSFTNLQQLLLRNLSNVEELKDLNYVKKLEVLDLFGTGIKDFPYEISELASLNKLSLPEISSCRLDWKRITWLPEEVNIEECGIFKVTETETGSSNRYLSITVTSTKLFEFFKKVPTLWKTYFTKFQINVCSPKHIADVDALLSGPEADMFRDIRTIHTTKSTNHRHSRCLDIRGFDTIPSSLDDVLRCAEHVFVTDNESNKSLHNLVGDNSIKQFWIERCNEMESIFKVEKEIEGATLMRGLEVLCVSNMAKLTNVLDRNEVILHDESFNNLKKIYLDCCPELVTLFAEGKAPENLEVIDIKFCDKLKSVVGKDTCEMQKLHTLRLLQLPQLKTIGHGLKSLEKLQTIRIEYCDALEMVSEETGLKLPSLRELHLESLPNLKNIGSITAPPSVLKKCVEECPLLKLL